jgi:hypothetical protein
VARCASNANRVSDTVEVTYGTEESFVTTTVAAKIPIDFKYRVVGNIIMIAGKIHLRAPKALFGSLFPAERSEDHCGQRKK